LRLLEYQAKELLRRAGIPVPRGERVSSEEEVRSVASRLGYPVVLKAQVPVGGRGRAGGVVVAESEESAVREARRILSSRFRGHLPESLLIEEFVSAERELYVGLILDRSARTITLISTPYGGVDVEEAASEHPESLVRVSLDPLVGLLPHHARRVADALLPGSELRRELEEIVSTLWRLSTELDAILLEVNPLAVTDVGLVALDARIEIDDSALFRHPEIPRPPPTWRNPREARAAELGIAYVELDGDIGTVANGAGLAMATMDAVAMAGGRPANFCDVGGGASAERVRGALEIIFSNPRVSTVLFNALCGITRGDEVARGIAMAVRELGISPEDIVVRLDGNMAEEGIRILEEAGLRALRSFREAVREVIPRASG